MVELTDNLACPAAMISPANSLGLRGGDIRLTRRCKQRSYAVRLSESVQVEKCIFCSFGPTQMRPLFHVFVWTGLERLSTHTKIDLGANASRVAVFILLSLSLDVTVRNWIAVGVDLNDVDVLVLPLSDIQSSYGKAMGN